VARVTGQLDDGDLEALVRAAAGEDRWAVLLPLLPLLDAPTQRRLAALPSVADPAVRGALLGAARDHGVGAEVEALLEPRRPAARRARYDPRTEPG